LNSAWPFLRVDLAHGRTVDSVGQKDAEPLWLPQLLTFETVSIVRSHEFFPALPCWLLTAASALAGWSVTTTVLAQDSSAVSNTELLRFLEPGETIVFRLSYGIFTNAGETRIATYRTQTEDGPRIEVEVTTRSKGTVNFIHPLNNRSVSTIDPATGRTLVITTEGKDGKREGRTTTVFDYAAGKIIHTDHLRPQRNGEIDIPDEPIYDVMISMLKFRAWDSSASEALEFDATFEDDFYELRARVVGEETVRTPAGKFDAVKITLEQLGELKGFFRKGGRMTFWISREEKPQIVEIDFKTKFGTIRSRLKGVEQSPAER